MQASSGRIAATRAAAGHTPDAATDHTADVLHDAGHRGDRKPGRGAT
ncbi:hypothetical protein ACHGLA_36260 [Streptomyces sp. YH02]